MEPSSLMRQDSEPDTSGSDTLHATVQQRRERGRIAQRQFRQRQIDTIRSLEEKLALYDNAFKSVREALATLGSVYETASSPQQDESFALKLREVLNQLNLAISQANAIKSNGRSPTRRLRRRNVRQPLLPAPNNTLVRLEGDSMTTSLPTSALTASTMPNDIHTYSPFSFQTSPTTPAQNEPVNCQSANLLQSPSGTDWGENTAPFDAVSLPSISFRTQPQTPVFDFVPYVAERATTFSGQLYWATLSLVHKLLSGLGFQSELVRRIFNYTARYEPLETIRFRTKARLVFFSTGVMLDEPPPPFVHPLHARVSDDIVRAGGTPHLYLDAQEVEEYISRKYTINKFLVSGKVAARVRPKILDTSTPEHVGIVSDSFLDQMAIRSICFGDGPRYHVDGIEQLAQHIMDDDAEAGL